VLEAGRNIFKNKNQLFTNLSLLEKAIKEFEDEI
jgi:hypothetical protein